MHPAFALPSLLSTRSLLPTPQFLPLHTRLTTSVPKLSKPSKCSCSPVRTPCMIQSPSEDGPPDLDAFFDAQRRAVGTSGAPVSLGTGRALLLNHQGDSSAAALAALKKAVDSLQQPPQILHVTISLDVDAEKVCNALKSELDIPIFGRTVNKKDANGTVEVLLLRSDVIGGVAVAEEKVTKKDDSVPSLEDAAKLATERALAALHGTCTFLLFSHSPGGEETVRRGIDKASPGVIAYGGPAVGEEETGIGWSLFSAQELTTSATEEMVTVAAVPGSLSFLFSAVIKSWAQPTYVEALPYMKPNYVDDATVDLLTAIRYDDWDKFLWCIEEQGVDINFKWTNKQNQIPLLAACARARTKMIKYLLDHGADVTHRNDGGFTASMYTRMLTEYDRGIILDQLKMLENAGANTVLSPDEIERLKTATNGRIVEE